MMLRRVVELEVRSVNEEKRQATFVVATERAVPMGGEREVLRMKGVRLERYKKNPILLDSHDRSGLGSVIGKTDVRVEGRQLVATTTYAKTARGEEAWQLVKDGFVRATSIGYQVDPDKVRTLRRGETDGDGDSKVDGPASIVNGWELLEISNVPVPADEDAVRRSFQQNQRGKKRMGKTNIDYAALVAAAFPARDGIGQDGDEDGRTSSGQDGQQATPDEDVAEKGAEITCPHCGKSFAEPEREADGDTQPGKPGTLAGTSPKGTELKALPAEIQARTLEANRRSALAVTPKGLEDVTERALAEGRPIEQIRKLLLKAQAVRFKPVGTLEPAPIEREGGSGSELPKEVSDDVLLRSITGLSE